MHAKLRPRLGPERAVHHAACRIGPSIESYLASMHQNLFMWSCLLWCAGPCSSNSTAHACHMGNQSSVRYIPAPWVAVCCLQIITVTSRYMLFNNSSEPLQYGQRGTSLVWQLPPGARYPFHWDSADSPFQMCIRPGVGNWNWSGAFQVS